MMKKENLKSSKVGKFLKSVGLLAIGSAVLVIVIPLFFYLWIGYMAGSANQGEFENKRQDYLRNQYRYVVQGLNTGGLIEKIENKYQIKLSREEDQRHNRIIMILGNQRSSSNRYIEIYKDGIIITSPKYNPVELLDYQFLRTIPYTSHSEDKAKNIRKNCDEGLEVLLWAVPEKDQKIISEWYLTICESSKAVYESKVIDGISYYVSYAPPREYEGTDGKKYPRDGRISFKIYKKVGV